MEVVSGGSFQPCVSGAERGRVDCSAKGGRSSSVATQMASSSLAVLQPFHP